MPRSSATSRHVRRLNACLLACALLVTVACGRDTPATVGVTTFEAGDRVALPAISGQGLDGQRLSVPVSGGAITILNAWASWCDPCREEMPLLQEIAAEFPDVAVIGLNVQDEPQAARQFLQEVGAQFPSIVDPDGALLATIPGVPPTSVPSTVIVDTNGAIAVRIIGPLDRTEIIQQVKALIAEGRA